MLVHPSTSSFNALQRSRCTPSTSLGSACPCRISPTSSRRITSDFRPSSRVMTPSFMARYESRAKTSTKRSLESLALPLETCWKNLSHTASSWTLADSASIASGSTSCGQRSQRDLAKVTKRSRLLLPGPASSSAAKSCSAVFSSAFMTLKMTSTTWQRKASISAQDARSTLLSVSAAVSCSLFSAARVLLALALASAACDSWKLRTCSSCSASALPSSKNPPSASASAWKPGATCASTSFAAARSWSPDSLAACFGASFTELAVALLLASSALARASLMVARPLRRTSIRSSRSRCIRSASSLAALSRSRAFATDFSMATMERICANLLKGTPCSSLESLPKSLSSCSSVSSNSYSSNAKANSSFRARKPSRLVLYLSNNSRCSFIFLSMAASRLAFSLETFTLFESSVAHLLLAMIRSLRGRI
mmetsp:Transcript_8926/g.24742  ORF Transcript_8926/g.24742 Transcript_8926/m.24742 type:complete len:425 (-) Transcript_8926:726-2000(-)